MEKISGNFVRSLRDQIEERKKSKEYDRSILRDSLNYILGIFKLSNCVELRAVKNFETNELSCAASLYTESEKIWADLQKQLRKRFPEMISLAIDPKILVVQFDLKGKLEGYRNKKNPVLIQFLMKGKHTLEMKLFLKNSDPFHVVYDKSYFRLKLWISSKEQIIPVDFKIESKDRNKEEAILDLDQGFKIKLGFNPTGEIKTINILNKRGRKKETETIKSK